MYQCEIWLNVNYVKNSPFWFIFDELGTFGANIWSRILSRHPLNDFLIFGHSILYVQMRNLIPSMDGPNYLKNSLFWVIFWMIFWTFGVQIWAHILAQTPYEWLFYLWDTQSWVYGWEIRFNVWVIGLLCQNVFKNKHNTEMQRKPPTANHSNILYTRCIISRGIMILDIP